MRKTIRKSLAWLVVLPTLASFQSWAVPAPGLGIEFSVGTNTEAWMAPIFSNGDAWKVNDGTNDWGLSELSWHNVTLNYDPFMSASVNIVNNALFTQTYTLIFTMPIAPPIFGGTLIGGSVGATFTDSNFSGIGSALSTDGPGTALYYGRIDNVDVLPLLSDVTTLSVLVPGDSASTNKNAGLVGPAIPGPIATNSIGIKFEFTLTPGDTATFSSSFKVEPVPEPAGLSLLAVGAFLAVRRRR
jgi:MYXO-CTERM domain-containing protein